jgi:hypothetical protein
MLSKRAVALFTIAIASSLLLPNSSVGSAFAAKKKLYKVGDENFSIDSMRSSSSVNADDLSGDKDDSAVKEKNSKSKCDQAPTLAEQRECYRLACNDYD